MVAALAVVLSIAGCGSSSKSSTSASKAAQPATTTLALSISEAGKGAKFAGPASVAGGLVTLTLTNSGKAPHAAQLVRVLPGHTIEQALKTLGGESHKTPEWIRAEGGIGLASPGGSASATLDLPSGTYAVVDLGASEGGQRGGPPAVMPLTVTPAQGSAALPSTASTITAANPSKDHYKWEVSGPLKSGENEVTFASKGKSALHEITAVRVTGNPSKAQILKDLSSNGPPPSYVDQASQTQTAVLDGGKSLIAHLTFSKPGTYVLFCHLNDRDGGKPHFKEGLLTTVTVN
jgi:hypothetical protein